MPNRDEFLSVLATDKGWDEDKASRMLQYANQVAAVESNNQPDAVQPGGPGRGKYQFELGSGGSGRNKTSIGRMKNFIAKHGIQPQFDERDMAIINSDDPDFSLLSEDAQDAIFIADAAMGTMPTTDLVDGRLSPEDAWIKYHWAGSERDEPVRRKHWKDTHEYRQRMYANAMRRQ